MPSYLLESPLIPPKPLDEVIPPPGMFWWQWGLIILAVLVAMLIIYFLTKITNKVGELKVKVNHLQEAEKRIKDLLAQKCDTKAFATELSIIMREYLMGRLDSPALFQTSEEINHSALSSLQLSPKVKEGILEYVNKLHRLKYDQNTPGSVIQQEVSSHLRLLLIEVDREVMSLANQVANPS